MQVLLVKEVNPVPEDFEGQEVVEEMMESLVQKVILDSLVHQDHVVKLEFKVRKDPEGLSAYLDLSAVVEKMVSKDNQVNEDHK